MITTLGKHAVHPWFAVADDAIVVGGKPITALAREIGRTPFYVYDSAVMTRKVAELKAALPAEVHVHYAMKANPMPAVVRHMAAQVDGIDVASMAELGVALAAGANPQVISFAGPGKTPRELQAAVDAGVILNVESELELRRLAQIAQSSGKRPRVAVRVNPDFELKASEGAGFLRILRTLRLLHTYQIIERLRADSPLFRRHEDVILAVVHLAVFLFIMSAIVYETQHWTNPGIANYVDALYFTVTALTTTGFGDITLPGTGGHLISVLIMICGVTLFLRLVTALVRPYKVRFPCPVCGLQRHDVDAVHCKACGTLLAIPDEGYF
jgi:voltage-gated potassium channel